MKTIKKNDEIRRVSDKDGVRLVKEGWAYIAKSQWKVEVRDKGKKVEPVKVAKKVEVKAKPSQYKKV